MESIVCPVCFRHCSLQPGQRGACRARENRDGRSVCVNYGLLTSLALDPIEKKPFAMFHPGTFILSAGSFGCNLRCPFCQNHEISQTDETQVRTEYFAPEEIAAEALREKENGTGCIGVAFTYNEPMVGWEYVRDTAKLVREKGMLNAVVTNGSVCACALEEVLPYVDAMNIDLKGYTKEYYDWIGGDLDTVKEFIRTAAAAGCHIELTTLILPGRNDSDKEMEALSAFVASVDPEIPLHVTRSFPRYRTLDMPAASPASVLRLAAVARRFLPHVFPGNL
ncbi:MAG: AmmeMemoRadiSam system radical SAM enzyme [Lachnospiraceae bacterium]|jgi:pyruvate formate lyase activating enzyme|nr:AmmeMemoRadiSam system radical SAM enzyme [Lachnospiraceae bacterium]